MKSLTALLLATSLAAPLALPAQTTVTWTGTAGNNLWTDAQNWDAGSVPATYDNVVISGSGTEVVIPFGTQVMIGTSWGSATATTATVNSGATLRVAGSVRTFTGINNDIQRLTFNDTSTLAVDAGGNLGHGYYFFNDDSRLTAAGTDALSAGSWLRFYGNSGFGSLAAGAITGGDIIFYGTREITFTPGTIVGGWVSLDENTTTTLNQSGTFVGGETSNEPTLFFQLRGNATATVTAAGALQSAEFNVGGTATGYLNATGALVNGVLALETNGTVVVGADNPLTNSKLDFADWTSTNTGGTLDLNGHTFTTTGIASTSFASNPVNEGTITSATAATLILDVTAGDERDGDRYHGAITGAISLVKNGNGLQYLGQAASPADGYAASTLTYTGPTTVNAGRLYVNAPLTNSTVTVNSGGLFGGTGSMNAITVNTGGTLDPSPGPIDEGDTGTMHATGVTFASGANFLFNLGDATGTAGASYDWNTNTGGWGLLDVANTLALPGSGGTLNLLVTTGGHYTGEPDWDFIPTPANFDPAANYTFRFAAAGSITGFDSTLFNIGYDPLLADRFDTAAYFTGTWSVSLHDNSLYLNYTGASAVPEPSTYATMLAAVALGVTVIRRRKALRAENRNSA
jgi:hypothetical protein